MPWPSRRICCESSARPRLKLDRAGPQLSSSLSSPHCRLQTPPAGRRRPAAAGQRGARPVGWVKSGLRPTTTAAPAAGKPPRCCTGVDLERVVVVDKHRRAALERNDPRRRRGRPVRELSYRWPITAITAITAAARAQCRLSPCFAVRRRFDGQVARRSCRPGRRRRDARRRHDALGALLLAVCVCRVTAACSRRGSPQRGPRCSHGSVGPATPRGGWAAQGPPVQPSAGARRRQPGG